MKLPTRIVRITLELNTSSNGVSVDVEAALGSTREQLDRFWVSGLDTALDEIRTRFMRGNYREKDEKK